MINNKGQTLVLFIIFIPILILLAAFIIDTGLIIHESTRLQNVSKTIMTDVYNTKNMNEESIRKLYIKNNIEVEKLQVKLLDDEIIIKNEYFIESIFGKMIGLKKYKIKINLKIKEENGKLKFIKE